MPEVPETPNIPTPSATPGGAMIRTTTPPAAKGKAKFTRDPGYFKQDGTPLIQEYDETWTEDKCPNGHDLNKVMGDGFVECQICGEIFKPKV